jgi:hypothetical protein
MEPATYWSVHCTLPLATSCHVVSLGLVFNSKLSSSAVSRCWHGWKKHYWHVWNWTRDLTEASHVLYHSPALMLVCFRKNRDNLAFVTSITQFYESYRWKLSDGLCHFYENQLLSDLTRCRHGWKLYDVWLIWCLQCNGQPSIPCPSRPHPSTHIIWYYIKNTTTKNTFKRNKMFF